MDALEKENHFHHQNFILKKNLIHSLPDLQDTSPLNSLESLNNLHDFPIQSLQTLEAHCGDKIDFDLNEDKIAFAKKKFRKIKVFLPFLKKMVEQKTTTQRINDYNYRKALRKHRSFNNNKDCDNSLESIIEDKVNRVDENMMEEFKKFPRSYFLGGVLKVKFSRYIYAGEHCGLRALTENALRNRAVMADDDCHCLSLDKEDFLKVLEDERTLHADKIDFFKRILEKFDIQKITRFSLLWEQQSFQNGEIIYQQDENSDALYTLFQGEVVV